MHLFQAASTGDARGSPRCWCVPGAERATGWPTRTRPSGSPAPWTRSRSRTPEDEAGPVLLARGDALLRAGEPAAAREAFTASAGSPPPGDGELLAQAALGYAGLGVAIVDLDAETIARLEEALDAPAMTRVLGSRLQARLAVELYYADDRTRSETLSAEAVATARAAPTRAPWHRP